MYQFIYDTGKVHRNEVNFSILRMVYAEVVLEVPVDWRTMEIQTNSHMKALANMTVPFVRKFPGEGLGKKAMEVEIPNNEIEWSETSSDDSDIGCDPRVRKEIEYSFKYGIVPAKPNSRSIVSSKDGQEQDATERDTVHEDGRVDCDGCLRYLAQQEQILRGMEVLVEEVEKKENELQECHAELQELRKQVREKDQLIAMLLS